jgi:hypothetical protein
MKIRTTKRGKSLQAPTTAAARVALSVSLARPEKMLSLK